jgi:hypothetical protein
MFINGHYPVWRYGKIYTFLEKLFILHALLRMELKIIPFRKNSIIIISRMMQFVWVRLPV